MTNHGSACSCTAAVKPVGSVLRTPPHCCEPSNLEPTSLTISILDAMTESLGDKICTVTPFAVKGNKRRLVSRILRYLPDKATAYVEPFAGSAAVYFAIAHRYPVNILNDLDGEIVNAFRVIQHPIGFRLLAHRLFWTPHALAEYLRAVATGREALGGNVDRAWAYIVRSCQSFQTSTEGGSAGNWARSYTASFRWYSQTKAKWLLHFHEALQGVFIESIDALDLIRAADREGTVFFVDPPYVNASGGYYKHVLPLAKHEELVQLLLNLKGRAIVTTYPHPVYEQLVSAGWHRETVSADRGCHSRVGNPNKPTEEWILVKHVS